MEVTDTGADKRVSDTRGGAPKVVRVVEVFHQTLAV